jgi:hypothetical protein
MQRIIFCCFTSCAEGLHKYRICVIFYLNQLDNTPDSTNRITNPNTRLSGPRPDAIAPIPT